MLPSLLLILGCGTSEGDTAAQTNDHVRWHSVTLVCTPGTTVSWPAPDGVLAVLLLGRHYPNETGTTSTGMTAASWDDSDTGLAFQCNEASPAEYVVTWATP